ncbi:hypothetical protein R4I97_11845 [Brachyspira pilosicoli]|uniref:hypothetical protein n=1 Tax=Brachyspira pilosicoli TaxID=52584 RepID=UPI0030075353
MDDALIRKIVLTVIEQINGKLANSMFVLSNNDTFLFKDELESIGYKLDIASNVNNANIDNYNIIVVDDLSVEMLSCISNLLYKDDNISFILNALLSGKKVIALKDIKRFNNYNNTASNALLSKLTELENIAKSYGLLIHDNNTFLQYFYDKNVVVNKESTVDLTDKKIITKSDIADVINNCSNIIVSNKAIITPLVIDYIKEKKINILYK